MINTPANLLILVTGATGFLGREVVRQLQEQHCRLRTSGRRASPPSDLPDYRPADLCNADTVARLVEGVDVVIHAAGLAHRHRATTADRASYYRINSACAEAVAGAAAAAGCRRMVLVSSVAVYGKGGAPTTELDPCRPVSDYARSKLEGERLAAEVSSATGLELAILRMATIYGEGDPGNVGRLFRAIQRRRFIWIGEGRNRKSLIHVEDAARACARVALSSDRFRGGVFNVAPPPCAIRDLVSLIAEGLGRRPPVLKVPGPAVLRLAAWAGSTPGLGRVARRSRGLLEKWLSEEIYDGSLFAKAYQWSPQIALPEGVARLAACHRGRAPTLA